MDHSLLQQQDSLRTPVLRLRAEPCSTNAHGQVHAGWLMLQIDAAGAIRAERLTKGSVTTVAVNAFQLTSPIYVGDVVSLYAECFRLGQKSVTLKISVEAERQSGEVVLITEVIVTYVAIDGSGKSRLIL